MNKDKIVESAVSGLSDAVVDVLCDEISLSFESVNYRINENKLRQIINKNYRDLQNKIIVDIKNQLFKKKKSLPEVIKKRRIVELTNENIENRTEGND